MALRLVSNGYVHLALGLSGICHALALQASSLGPISTLEEIEAAVQQLPPAKRAQFRAQFRAGTGIVPVVRRCGLGPAAGG